MRQYNGAQVGAGAQQTYRNDTPPDTILRKPARDTAELATLRRGFARVLPTDDICRRLRLPTPDGRG